MRVVMPIATTFPEAVSALLRSWESPEIVSVAFNDYAYWELFCRLWRDGEPFILVEHDIVVTHAVLRGLAECPHPWCGNPYHQAPGEPVTGLGCTKFVPGGQPLHYTSPAPVWQNVDSVVAGAMTELGREIHEHTPWLRHLNTRVAAQQKAKKER